jgi:ribosomal protein L37AE/L43A
MARKETRKKPPCPKCGSTNVVPICYGFPTPEALKEQKQGKIVLGGCCIDRDIPKWHCNDCEHEWSNRHESE